MAQLYRDVIGREPLPVEISYWEGRLQHKSRQRHGLPTGSPLSAQCDGPRPAASFMIPGFLPDPASPTFRDPSGPFFHSEYYFNYERGPGHPPLFLGLKAKTKRGTERSKQARG